jgi:hypothetical protein
MPQERAEDHIGYVGPKKVRNGSKADARSRRGFTRPLF